MPYSSTKRLIKPFRGYGEHEVINMFAFDLETVNKGTFVKVLGAGWKNTDDALNITSATAVGASYSNVVSDRYSTTARVTTAGTGDLGKVVGLLLNDVRETDENGEKLIYNPRKAAELSAVVSGQTVPVLKRGVILAYATGATAGNSAFINANGELETNATIYGGSGGAKVGTYLGSADDDGYALLNLDL
jgi:hypothetical protein